MILLPWAPLAMIGIPRAVFMLMGGVVTARYPVRTIMLVSDVLHLQLTMLRSVMILAGWMQLWLLYLLALLFGTIAGFFIPASGVMIPLLVKPEDLTLNKSIYQGTAYLSGFLGPLLAGGMGLQPVSQAFTGA